MKENVTAVIRGAGERTEELCRHILHMQLPEKNVFVVHGCPSTEGTRMVYEKGLEEGRKWTLFVDADQLLLKGSIEFLYETAESHEDENPFGVKGIVYDKIFLDKRGRGCGPILYRTELFEKAMEFIPDPYCSIRPDSHIIKNMKNRFNCSWIRKKKYVALHDYEQYYSDIYKKMIINSRKMRQKCDELFPLWKVLSIQDKDYLICLYGYIRGLEYEKEIAIDYSKDYGYDASIQEKEPINNFNKVMKNLCLI